METARIKLKKNNFYTLIMVAVLLFTFGSCATKNSFLSSPVVPAARGTVKVSQDNNDNYVIKVNVTNLAEASRLQPAKNMYVVWMEGEDNETKNLGQMTSSSSFMSKNLKASFETVSPVKPKKIFITGENDPSVQYPNYSDMILTTDYFRGETSSIFKRD